MIVGLLFLILICLIAVLFLNCYPSIGGHITKKQKKLFQTMKNYKNGRFQNEIPAKMDMSFSSMVSMLKEYLVKHPNQRPEHPPLFHFHKEAVWQEKDSVTWFGHSTFLIQLDGKNILFDPVFSSVSSPVSFIGTRRYSDNIFESLDQLPTIDVVFISHDHYDHMDYRTIVHLKERVTCFFVPYGVGVHLQKWGVKASHIKELNWWEECEWHSLKIASTPSRHFSGRGLLDYNKTLWTSWVIMGHEKRLFYSGDGGYGPHFKEIGEKYGPFDMTFMEGGQYDEKWDSIHMFPEQSVQAHLDVKGKEMFLMHWGAFTLAYHAWTDPIDRAIRAATEKGVSLVTAKLGETISLPSSKQKIEQWWK